MSRGLVRSWVFVTALALCGGLAFFSASPLQAAPPTSEELDRANALNSEGVALFKERDFVQALRRFEQASKLDPASEAIRGNVGRAHAALAIALLDDIAAGRVPMSDTRRALSRFELALVHWPGDATTHHAIGWCHFHLREYSRAVKVLEHALTLDPESAGSLRLLSISHERLGDTKAALAAVDTLVRVAPSPRWKVRQSRLRFDLEASRSYRKLESDRFVVLYPESLPTKVAIDVRRSLEATVDEFSKRWSASPTFPVTVICYPPGEFSARTGFHEDVAGAFDGRVRIAFPKDLEEGGLNIEQVARHEAIHLLLHALPQTLPRWLDEGIATRLDGDWDPAWRQRFLQLVRSAPEVGILDRDRAHDPDDSTTWSGLYLHGAALIDHLVEQGGAFRLDLVLREIARGTSIDQAFEEVFGDSIPELDRTWRAALSIPEPTSED